MAFNEHAAKYPPGSYSLLSDAVLKEAVAAKAGPRMMAVLVLLSRRVFASGEMAPFSSAAMQAITQHELSADQISTAMSKLRSTGLIAPIDIMLANGEVVPDRSQFRHVARYRYPSDLWSKVPAVNKTKPDGEGSLVATPSVGARSKYRFRSSDEADVRYESGTYIAVPHYLLIEALKHGVGRNGIHVLLRLAKYVDKRGVFIAQPSCDIQEATGLTSRQVEAGVADLKARSVIAAAPMSHACYGSPAEYQFVADVWEAIPQEKGAVKSELGEHKKENSVLDRWGSVEFKEATSR